MGYHVSSNQINGHSDLVSELPHQMQREEFQWTESPPHSSDPALHLVRDHVEEKRHDSEDEIDQDINRDPAVSDIIAHDFEIGCHDANGPILSVLFNDQFYANKEGEEYTRCYLYAIKVCDEQQNGTDTSMGFLCPRQIPESEIQHFRFPVCNFVLSDPQSIFTFHSLVCTDTD